ncbi:GroES-like protein [Aureobasidium namibiae CBS 147.97]|uniref:GroES-like protein n=1 Tax=Aureobasidium namibiae CBS 147.97 TaxID=1043004 RepID=A0A074WDW0_9PEZI
MQAYRYETADGVIKQRKLPIPEPAANEVLITVKAAGLCHSDLHILSGGFENLQPFGVHAPLTLGHEVAGIVNKVGSQVASFKPGDRVAVAQVGYPKENANWDISVGLGVDGGLAEYCISDVSQVVHVPANVPLHLAAVATDAISTAYHAVVTEAEAGPGRNIAILGLGGLGLNGVVAASLRGANVYGFDIDEKKFEAARDSGAIACHQSLNDVDDAFFDAVVDFAGVGKTTALAINRVKVGGVVVLVGLGVNEATLPTSLLTMKSIHLRGCMGASLQEYREVLEYVASGKITPVTEQISFEDVSDGLERLAAGKISGRLWTDPSAMGPV